jgi:hypothetical protein
MLNDTSLKLRAWWLREELDDRLAHGADPQADPLLSLRAAQLRLPATRRRIAAGLEEALDEARRTWSLSARLPLRRSAIRGCADDVVALVARLRDGRPVDVQGVAMASRVLYDGTGPLYRDGSLSLRYALRSALLALDPLEVVAAAEMSRVA